MNIQEFWLVLILLSIALKHKFISYWLDKNLVLIAIGRNTNADAPVG